MTSRPRLNSRNRGVGIGLLLGLALVAAIAAGQAGSDPTYYVDGARPIVGEDGRAESCVPYAADRPDVSICGPLPEGFVPAAPHFDQAICDRASAWLALKREEAEASGMSADEVLDEWPNEDPNTCQVVATDPVWSVAFQVRGDDSRGVRVPYDPSGEVPWAAHP